MIIKGDMNPWFLWFIFVTFLIKTKVNTVITLQKKITIKGHDNHECGLDFENKSTITIEEIRIIDWMLLIWVQRLSPTLSPSSQVGLLLLSKVVESNPEPFKPHYHQLLQLFGDVLQQDLENPACLYYCILTLTAITAYVGSEEMVRRSQRLSLTPPFHSGGGCCCLPGPCCTWQFVFYYPPMSNKV